MDKLIYDHIMVRYGELTTKGKNRKEFMKYLLNNIKKRLVAYQNLTYNMTHDGIFIKLNGEDYDLVKEDLKQVFGYAYFSGTIITSLNIDEIKATALKLVTAAPHKTFKISTSRSNKNYPMISDEINRACAGNILANTDLKVDVHNPDITIYIKIGQKEAAIGDEKIKGIGGYPTGVNGTSLLMMSGGIDSPVAGYMTMKRGLKIECIHFASMPYTSKQALDKVKALAKQLSVYQKDIIMHVINFTDLQLKIYEVTDESYAITIMRRMMYRIADRIAQKRKIKTITNGESIGQVASQTPESISVIAKVSDTLILRPLCMMDKVEIIDIARKINTFETSILPYEDCCTIFDPKNPITKPKEDKCLYYESKFDYNQYIDKCVDEDEIIKLSYLDTEEDLF